MCISSQDASSLALLHPPLQGRLLVYSGAAGPGVSIDLNTVGENL